MPGWSRYERNKARIAVLVSGGGTNLEALLERPEAAGQLGGGEIVAGPAPARRGPSPWSGRRSAGACPASACPGRPSLGQRSQFEAGACVEEAGRPSGWTWWCWPGSCHILSGGVRGGAGRTAIVNVHPALIPAFCGAGAYGLQVHEAGPGRRGVKVTGATVHSGERRARTAAAIVLQKAVAVRAGDTPEALQRRVMEEAEWVLLPQCRGAASARGGSLWRGAPDTSRRFDP